jgi:hypothetical protein
VSTSGNVITDVRETIEHGQIVRRLETITIILEDGLQVRITREFRLIDGVLTLVRDHSEALQGDDDTEGDEDEREQQSER